MKKVLLPRGLVSSFNTFFCLSIHVADSAIVVPFSTSKLSTIIMDRVAKGCLEPCLIANPECRFPCDGSHI